MSQIISASRRTDIPAFYSDWFVNRIRAGWCLVPNPVNARQVSRVSLQPEDVTAIVFWSKNPAPLLEHLTELDERGYRYYFQFTLMDNPPAFEPHLPSFAERLDTFLELNHRLGPARVIWRYDPIVISNRTPLSFHQERFGGILEKVGRSCERVMVSFIDYHRKTDRRLAQLEREGFCFDRNVSTNPVAFNLLAFMSGLASSNGLKATTCAETNDYSRTGVEPGCCIDGALIERLWSIRVDKRKDPGQREACLCTLSRDIGVSDTCGHGCVYCYATRSHDYAYGRFAAHIPTGPAIWVAQEERPASYA